MNRTIVCGRLHTEPQSGLIKTIYTYIIDIRIVILFVIMYRTIDFMCTHTHIHTHIRVNNMSIYYTHFYVKAIEKHYNYTLYNKHGYKL